MIYLSWSAFKQRSEFAAVPEPLVTDSGIKILDQNSPDESEEAREKYLKVVAWDQSERKINLKRTPVPIKEGEATLNVQLTTKGTCFPGDANAIEMDLNAAPNHKLLASLENLSGDGKSIHWDLPSDFLKTGSATQVFRIPAGSKPAQYGFYLCTADKSDKSCQGKTVRDINEIFTEHVRKDPKAGKELRILFFQYFIVDDRGVAAFSSYKNEDQKFEELKLYLKDRGLDGQNALREVDAAKKKMNTLLSYPFVFDGKSLKIELPQYNVAACGQKGN
ncbi:hypothetical protein EBR03_03800 [bacterium]|nr:hypothetical protein [bacterium]